MPQIDFYNLMMNTYSALFGAAAAVQARSSDKPGEALAPILQLRRGLAESPHWFLIQAAEFDPEPLSVTNLRIRDIYASKGIVQALLELMAGEKWFDRVDKEGEACYYLTGSGRETLTSLRDSARRRTANLEPLLPVDLNSLEHLLGRIIEASLRSSEPPGTWCLAHSHRRAPDPATPALIKISHHFVDFNAFRDDAHMAAWQPLQIEGYVWEAFSFVWSDMAVSAEALFDRLVYRGYSRVDYATALQELSRHDWLEEISDQPGNFRVTEMGQIVRQEAEALTDAYFYAPWSELNEDEKTTVHTLLAELQNSLEEIAKS